MNFMVLSEGGAAAAQLADVITTDMLTSVLDQLVGLLPIVIPAVLLLLGIRKGLSFVLGMIRKA